MIDAFDHSVLVARIDARPDLSGVAAMPRGAERRTAAFDALTATAQASQRPVLAALQPLIADGTVRAVESLYLPNALVIQPAAGRGSAVRDALAGVAHVETLRENRPFTVASAGHVVPSLPRPSRGLDMTHARDAWQAGADGHGVTVGVVDSGFDATHAALEASYRGWRGGGASEHDHNWGDCVAGSPTPVESSGHGTQVASEVAGVGIGTAPRASLIYARASKDGASTPVSSLRALQWMLAPTDASGAHPDPRLGADVVNCSWGTGDGRDVLLRESFDGLRDAGIVTVAAAGNGSLNPDGTVSTGNVSAPASFPGFVSVGAVDTHGKLADTSSRGPSPLPHAAGQFTPLLVAPGVVVPAAVAGGGYTMASGTSIAAPLVAGAIADLMSAEPTATNAQIVHALTSTAHDVAAPGPDDAAGYGLIDIAAAARALHALVAG